MQFFHQNLFEFAKFGRKKISCKCDNCSSSSDKSNENNLHYDH